MTASMIVVDLETTGLSLNCGIVEAGFCTVDGYGQPIGPVMSSIIAPHAGCTIEDKAMDLHANSGLLHAMKAASVAQTFLTYSQLDLALCTAVQGVKTPKLVGNNPAFDRSFLERYCPAFAARIRGTVDVTALRTVASMALEVANPYALKDALTDGKHRAASDVSNCVKELGLYLNLMRSGCKSPKTNVGQLAYLMGLGQ